MAQLGFAAIPTHPGEVIKDEIEYRKISQRSLANRIDMSPTVLNEILNARRPLTPNTALLIEAALDIPADSLMHIQLKYNMHIARQDKTLLQRLAKIKNVAAIL